MRNDRQNVIVELSTEFALEVIRFCELLEGRGKKRIADQLLRSGTSIGANVHEAQNAESKKDFIHKIKIAAKEAEETRYWLKLCEKAESYPANSALMEDAKAIIKVLNKIIATSKKSN